MKSTLIFNQHEIEYRAAKPRLSQTVLKTLLAQSPAHAKYQLDNPQEPTQAQKLGVAAHCRILEGVDIFEQQYAISPTCDRRTKDGKAIHESFLSEHGAKLIITSDEYLQIHGMATAIESHALAGALFKGGAPEVSAYGAIKGVQIKGRFDYFHEADGVIVDLKTTLDASPSEVQRYAVKYGLHIQQYVYSEIYQSITGKAPADFVFVMVEKNPPYGVAVVRLTDAAVKAAAAEVSRGLEIWEECLKTNSWSAYGNGVISIDLPAWQYKKTETAQ